MTPLKFDILLSQLSEWSRYVEIFFNKTPIISRKAQEAAYLYHIRRSWLINIGLNLLWINKDSILRDDMPQECNLIKPKFTPAKFCIQLLLSQCSQHNSEVLLIFHLTLGINQNVTNENNHKVIQIWLENPIHQIYKVCEGIG